MSKAVFCHISSHVLCIKMDHKPTNPENYALLSDSCDAKGQKASKLNDRCGEQRRMRRILAAAS